MAALTGACINESLNPGFNKNFVKAATFSIGLLRATPIDFGISSKQGTISLYEIATNKFGLITNYQMIPYNDPGFACGSYINFEGFGRLILRPSDIEVISTSEELDATVIELSESCVALLKERGAKFLNIATARVGEEVTIVKSPFAFFSVVKGTILSFRKTTLLYSSKEGSGSNGSPILYGDLQAIGLIRHNNSEPLHTFEEHCSATLLSEIVAMHSKTRESLPS